MRLDVGYEHGQSREASGDRWHKRGSYLKAVSEAERSCSTSRHTSGP